VTRAAALVLQAEALEALAAGLRAEAAALVDGDRESTPAYMTIADYAARVALSKRTIVYRIGEGLPTVGRGRGRRVDVAAADEWLKSHHERDDELVDDALENQARRAAARTLASTRTPQKRNGGSPGKGTAVSGDEDEPRTTA